MNTLLALFVSFLPRRYWRNASGIGILVSAFLQLGLSAALLISTYTRYAHGVSNVVSDVTIEAATRDEAVDGHLRVGGAMAVNALTPIGFLVVSRVGQVLVYLVFSGVVRLLGYASDHPCGDPLLTLVDEYAWDLFDYLKRRTTDASRRVWLWWRANPEE